MPWADNYLQPPLSRRSALFSCIHSSMDIMEFPCVAPSPAIEAKKRKWLSCISHQQHILRDVSGDLQESTILSWAGGTAAPQQSRRWTNSEEIHVLMTHKLVWITQCKPSCPAARQSERPGLLEFNDPVPPSAISMWGQLMIWIDGTTQSIKTPGYMTGFQMQSACLSLNIFTSLISSSFLAAFSTAACFQNF